MTTGSSELSNLRRESLLQEHFLFLTLDRVSCVWAGLGSGHGSSGSSAQSSVSSQQQPGHWHQGRHGCCGTRPLPDTRRTCRHQANLLYLKSCLLRAVWGRGQHSSPSPCRCLNAWHEMEEPTNDVVKIMSESEIRFAQLNKVKP